MKTDYRSEFPDFDYDLPAIAGLADQSWRNDVCPVLRDATGTVELWCNYADANEREFPMTSRFMLAIDSQTGVESESLDEGLLDAVAKAVRDAASKYLRWSIDYCSRLMDREGNQLWSIAIFSTAQDALVAEEQFYTREDCMKWLAEHYPDIEEA